MINAQGRELAGMIEDIMYLFGSQGMEEECCGEKISAAEFRSLRAALRSDVCTMQDIARSASVTKSGATRIIARLEEKGLAYREQNQSDGRVCCVGLTEEGKALLNRIEDQLTNKMLKVLTAMEPAMRDILLISLSTFLQMAKRHLTIKRLIM